MMRRRRGEGNVAGFDPGAVEIRAIAPNVFLPGSIAGEMCVFTCPRRGGICAVPIVPLTNVRGNGWHWDGNREAPTLTPSIDCVTEWEGKRAGCGWHGWIRAGKLVEA